MTARTDLNRINLLINQYDEVTNAIASLQAGGTVVSIVIVDSSTGGHTVSGLNLSPPGLITVLQTRQTNLATQLTAFGITL